MECQGRAEVDCRTRRRPSVGVPVVDVGEMRMLVGDRVMDMPMHMGRVRIRIEIMAVLVMFVMCMAM